ncbi:alpha/beta fold hydrolase [Streptomyces cacaoi]
MSEHAAVELSPEAIEFAEWLATGQNPPSELDAARIQAEQVHLAAREPEGVTYREVDAGGVPGIWCEPVDANTDYVLLHSHAGDSVLASAPVDRKLAGHIAKAAGAPVLVIDFRRAPEHKYPAQVDDAEAAFNWLLSEGYEPGNIITIGHSIGGFIAVALALRLRDLKQPLPGAIVSISPWCDLEMRSRAGPAIAGFLARPETITRGRAGRSPPGEARARACMPPS